MSAATLTLLRDLAEHEAAIAKAYPHDTCAASVNRAYHVGRSYAFTEAAEIAAEQDRQGPHPTPMEAS